MVEARLHLCKNVTENMSIVLPNKNVFNTVASIKICYVSNVNNTQGHIGSAG